jgi:regulator of replication initiation timing
MITTAQIYGSFEAIDRQFDELQSKIKTIFEELSILRMEKKALQDEIANMQVRDADLRKIIVDLQDQTMSEGHHSGDILRKQTENLEDRMILQSYRDRSYHDQSYQDLIRQDLSSQGQGSQCLSFEKKEGHGGDVKFVLGYGQEILHDKDLEMMYLNVVGRPLLDSIKRFS